MTINQKLQIEQMREKGCSIPAISNELGIPAGTIKSYLSRRDSGNRCEQCGTPLQQPKKRKKKRFCSSGCRMKWWREHREISGKTVSQICPVCKNTFITYPSKHQIFCSKSCSGKARWTNAQKHHDVSDNG